MKRVANWLGTVGTWWTGDTHAASALRAVFSMTLSVLIALSVSGEVEQYKLRREADQHLLGIQEEIHANQANLRAVISNANWQMETLEQLDALLDDTDEKALTAGLNLNFRVNLFTRSSYDIGLRSKAFGLVPLKAQRTIAAVYEMQQLVMSTNDMLREMALPLMAFVPKVDGDIGGPERHRKLGQLYARMRYIMGLQRGLDAVMDAAIVSLHEGFANGR